MYCKTNMLKIMINMEHVMNILYILGVGEKNDSYMHRDAYVDDSESIHKCQKSIF